MTFSIHRLSLAALLSAGAIALAGCGGGGGGGNGGYFPIVTAPPATPGPPEQPPVVAADPYDTFVAFVKGLVGSLLDTAEPVDVAAFDPPPTSETKEPIPTE